MEQFHKHCFDEWLHVTKDDYDKADNYYNDYIALLEDIIDCDQSELDSFKSEILKNNPWKDCIEGKRKPENYRSIADSDYAILVDIIEDEINHYFRGILSKNLFRFYKPDKLNDFNCNKIKNKFAKPLLEELFRDFEQAFDGNFLNPSVVVLGINPKLSKLGHKSYQLIDIYKNPFKEDLPTWYKNQNNDIYKYYFGNNGFLFKSSSANFKNNFTKRITKENRLPFALLEFFPYATKSEEEWVSGFFIGRGDKDLKKYISMERVLPSQIWLLCLLAYLLKTLSSRGEKVTIFVTKKEKTFKDNFLIKFFNELGINGEGEIVVLEKKDNRDRKLYFKNISSFFGNGNTGIKNKIDFYNKIWDIKIGKNENK